MLQHDIRLHSKTVPVKRNVLFIHDILLRQDTSYSSVILICFCPLSLAGTSGCSHLHHNWTASTAKREQKKGPRYNTLALVSSGSAVNWNKMLTISPFTPSSIATQLNKHHPTQSSGDTTIALTWGSRPQKNVIYDNFRHRWNSARCSFPRGIHPTNATSAHGMPSHNAFPSIRGRHSECYCTQRRCTNKVCLNMGVRTRQYAYIRGRELT